MKSLLIFAILMWQTEPVKPTKKERKKARQEHRQKAGKRKIPYFY